MKFPDNITMGDKYTPAMKITDQKKADEYFKACVEHNVRVSENTKGEAETIERGNLGYFAGYYDTETRLRVEKLFDCSHPIFGKAKDGIPTAEEAFEAGKKLAAEDVH